MKRKLHTVIARVLTSLLVFAMLLTWMHMPGFAATESVYGENLVHNNGTMDGILAAGETEKTLNGDWGVSYPVATFGSDTADSPAKIKDVDGNAVLVLEKSSGDFASYFADLSKDHDGNVPEGTYELSIDLKPVGDNFATDNVGFNLYSQYTDVRIYDNGWQNCTELENGWLRYTRTFEINANSVDSIQMWFNTMGASTLYVDNLSFRTVTEVQVTENLVHNNGTMDGILAAGETEKTLNGDWLASYPVATFGSDTADSPAKIKDIDGNAVLVLEKSSGDFASYFADLSKDHDGPVPEGTYELSMDLKPVGDNFATDNVGFNLYNQYGDVRIYDNGWQNCTELENGWLRYTRTFEINANSVDSIQMWFNTMGASTLYVDNLSFRLVPQAVETVTLNAEYIAGSGAAIHILLPNGAETITVAEKAGYVLETDLDYTYAEGVLTLKNEYADGLTSGMNKLLITAGDVTYELKLVIKQAKPSLPANREDFIMQETLVGGDFSMFETGFAFSLEQVEGWGSNVTYDDPGVIVDLDGNKVLRLQKDQKSSYSSAFAFLSPTIQAGDTLTFRFDYKLDAKDPSVYMGADINLCFVSASNMQMNLIALDGSKPAQTRGDGDYQWDVQYEDLGDGWVRVTMDFVANTALLSYNSMRFLLPTDKAQEGDALYIDNVSLVLWAEAEAPVYGGGELAFNKAKPADVYALVNLQALDPQSISLNGTAVDAKNWSINPAKDTITLSKDYLATLENGKHTFTVKTAGGECSFDITVSGEAAGNNQNNNNTTQESDNSWIWIVVGVAAVAVAAVVIVILRKKK